MTRSKWDDLRLKTRVEQVSASACLRLEWIIFYHTVGGGNVTYTASHFGLSRKTLHKWLARFDETNLKSLEEHSRAPHHPRRKNLG